MQVRDSPPRALLETRDSLGPFVAPGPARTSRAAVLANRVARAGAFGGLVASFVAGVPYYFAVRDELPLPWLRIAPLFVAFLIAAGALYGTGAAYGLHRLVSILRPRRGIDRALVAVLGATLGAAAVGPLPGSLGLAYFGSLPYPFMRAATLALAPFVGTAMTSFALAAAPGTKLRAAVAAVVATLMFCGVAVLVARTVDDATMVAAFRDATATTGHQGTPLGLGIVGLFVGALLGLGLGCQMGISVALSGARELTSAQSTRSNR